MEVLVLRPKILHVGQSQADDVQESFATSEIFVGQYGIRSHTTTCGGVARQNFPLRPLESREEKNCFRRYIIMWTLRTAFLLGQPRRPLREEIEGPTLRYWPLREQPTIIESD